MIVTDRYTQRNMHSASGCDVTRARWLTKCDGHGFLRLALSDDESVQHLHHLGRGEGVALWTRIEKRREEEVGGSETNSERTNDSNSHLRRGAEEAGRPRLQSLARPPLLPDTCRRGSRGVACVSLKREVWPDEAPYVKNNQAHVSIMGVMWGTTHPPSIQLKLDLMND